MRSNTAGRRDFIICFKQPFHSIQFHWLLLRVCHVKNVTHKCPNWFSGSVLFDVHLFMATHSIVCVPGYDVGFIGKTTQFSIGQALTTYILPLLLWKYPRTSLYQSALSAVISLILFHMMLSNSVMSGHMKDGKTVYPFLPITFLWCHNAYF